MVIYDIILIMSVPGRISDLVSSVLEAEYETIGGSST
jgi:hypothetical protein